MDVFISIYPLSIKSFKFRQIFLFTFFSKRFSVEKIIKKEYIKMVDHFIRIFFKKNYLALVWLGSPALRLQSNPKDSLLLIFQFL